MPDQNNPTDQTQSPVPGVTPPVSDTPPPPPPTTNVPPPFPTDMVTEEVTPPPAEPAGSAAPGLDIPPVITPMGGKKKFGGKKVIATILGLLVLVGGLGAGIILVKQQQDIREKAAGPTCYKECIDAGNTPTECRGLKKCNGETCNSNSDCQSNNCQVAPGGKYCIPAGQVVSAPVAEGGTCGTTAYNRECEPGLVCQNNKCVKKQEKKEEPSKETSPKTCASAGGSCLSVDAARYQAQVPGCQNRTDLTCPQSGQACIVCSTTAFQCKTSTPNIHIGDYGYCGWEVCKGTIYGRPVCSNGCTCPQSAPSCTGEEVPGTAGTSFASKFCVSPGVAEKAPSTPQPPSEGPAGQCLNVKAYDTSWNLLSSDDLAQLKAGDVVRFAVAGTATGGGFDKARFKINGVQRPEVTQKKPGTEEFYDEYTIPEGVTTFSIGAQIHHTTLGWSN